MSSYTDPAELMGADPDRGTDSFPFRPGQRVVLRDTGEAGTVEKVWEPTIRRCKGFVRPDTVKAHPDLDDHTQYWAMSTWVRLDNGEGTAVHALRVRYE